MLRLALDLYDPGQYFDPGGWPLYFARSNTGTVSGSTVYSENAFVLQRGATTFTQCPPGAIVHIVEARAFLLRTSGAGILDAFGWCQFAGSTLSNFLTWAGDLTALSANGTRSASANNTAIADALIVRDVVLFPGETIAWHWQTASDVTSWNVQTFLRGALYPRGNLNRV